MTTAVLAGTAGALTGLLLLWLNRLVGRLDRQIATLEGALLTAGDAAREALAHHERTHHPHPGMQMDTDPAGGGEDL